MSTPSQPIDIPVRPASSRGDVARWLAMIGIVAVGLSISFLLASAPRNALQTTLASTPSEPYTTEARQAVTMHFADGSDLALIAGARGRLAGMSEHGGRIVLEAGTARASIQERPGAAWAIVAGRSSILTSGGTLEVTFSPDDDELRVLTFVGAATVMGPSSPEGTIVTAGGGLLVRGREQSAITPAGPAANEGLRPYAPAGRYPSGPGRD